MVSLFNGISTFVGYLMPKLSSENSSGTIYPIARRIRGFIPFPRVNERNSATRVRTRVLRFCSPAL